MRTFLKLAGLTTWLIGTQLSNAGAAVASVEFRVPTGAIYQVSFTAVAIATADDRANEAGVYEQLSGFTPPKTGGGGGPGRTGDSGTR